MKWQEVCDNPMLQNLPFKIELNEWGQVVMSPASNKHGRQQMVMGLMLNNYIINGEIIVECSIDTKKGVKVVDVVWTSQGFLDEHGYETPYTIAPELCVEIISPSNSANEMNEKIDLYLAKGAKEVWICDDSGNISFYGHAGKLTNSKLFPNFPNKI